MIVYGFHPNETFSIEVGKRLEKNPPSNADVMAYTPSTIKHDYLLQDWKVRVKASCQGARELRKYAQEKYGELPFIIELHDTPLYAGPSGGEHSEWYWLMYPNFNKKLGAKLDSFKQSLPNEKMLVLGDDMRRTPAFYSLTVESWPVQYRQGGKFEMLKVEEEEDLVRKVVEYLQKNGD